MQILHCANSKELANAVREMSAGDIIETDRLSDIADGKKDLFSLLAGIAEKGGDFVCTGDGIDTRNGQGTAFFALCRALYDLGNEEHRAKRRAGIERAKAEGRYKGRKPIAIDESLFESVAHLWENGEISARDAMTKLDLKPNTFYRRMKEREVTKMKDLKKVEHELKAEMKEAAKKSRKEIDELKKQVRSEAKEIKKAADEKLELHDVEKEIRKDKLKAEIEHHEAIKEMKKEVAAEAKEIKEMLEKSED